MTPEIALTLAIIATAVVLFATEKLRVDVIALLVLLTLVATRLVTTDQAFAGFANPAVITVWAVYIVSGGLMRTGVADSLGRMIAKVSGTGEARLVVIVMLTCGVMSAFMNNIGATAVLMPAVIGVARTTGVPASKLLIPLAFSSLLGGNMTQIGTPPNILASSMLTERGLTSLAFFDFTPTGVIVFATGVVYMAVLGRHLLPSVESDIADRKSQIRDYISEVVVSDASPLKGLTLAESAIGTKYGLVVVAVRRKERLQGVPRSWRFASGDILYIEGKPEDLYSAAKELQLVVEAGETINLGDLDPAEAGFFEATLAPGSNIAGRTLKGIRFRHRFGFTALAIWRGGELITERLRDVRLRFGDALLLQGPPHLLPTLHEGGDFLVLEPAMVQVRRTNRAKVALGILIGVVGMVGIGGVDVAPAMVGGAVLMVLAGCLTMDEAYGSIEWRSVFLIAGMLPLGTAMATTGTARFLGDLVIAGLGQLGPLGMMGGIYILAGLITEPMSNAAATVLVVPIAIDTALEVGADPRSFVMATVIGASTSFLTPVGHQANVLVFGAGGYRFVDYTRVGCVLNLVLFVVAMIALAIIWPP